MSASMDQLPAEDWQALCMDELNRRKNLGRKLEEAQEEIHQLKKQIAAAPTPAAQGAVENGVVLLKGLLPTVQNAVLEEMVRLILAHRPPAVQGGDTREAAPMPDHVATDWAIWLEGCDLTEIKHDGMHPAFVQWEIEGYPQGFPRWLCRKVAGMIREHLSWPHPQPGRAVEK